jgi:sugar lactone lactonase YvrE
MAETSRLWLVSALSIGLHGVWSARPAMQSAPSGQVEPAPTFELDPAWPKPLPNNWGLGIVWGVDVDSRDHVWIVHQTAPSPTGQRYTEQIEKAGKTPAPAVLEFDPQGNLVQAWGMPGQGGWTQGKGRAFPAQAIKIDWKGNIWVSEETRGHAVVKFTREGKFLLQIGEVDRTNGSADTKLLGGPSGIDFDPDANEVYIADGYINARVIVFDADTGAYKRHFGRYGKPPDDAFEADKKGRPRFGHAVNVSRDKLVYVADRSHNRIFVHKPDGSFIKEMSLPGPANSVAFSPDKEQYYLYAGGMNSTATMYILRRSDLQLLGSFKSAGQHYFAADSKGNLYTCGLQMPQKFVLKSLPKKL